MLRSRGLQLGFTLVEISIALGLLAILIALAVPTFGEWLQNQQTRAATEATLNGLQVARAEAVRRNAQVRFQFVTDLTAGCDLSATNLNWVVSVGTPKNNCNQPIDVVPPAVPGPVIQSKSAQEVSPNAVVIVTPTGAPPSFVTFNGLGGVVSPSSDGTAPITTIDICNPAITGANTHPLRVVVSAGGSVRMCDPKVADVTDARACPTPGVNAACP
jgi:type IV fimbrial biogenesis protein FimT